MAREDHLITVDRLAEELMSAAPPVLLDVRWTLQQPDGSADYAVGHVPGAHYVSLDEDLADHGPDHGADGSTANGHAADPTAGRHPLPSPASFEQTVRGWGIDAGTPVVVYDDNSGLGAARAWWLLRWAGVGNVRLLDGGFGAWRAAGRPVSTEAPEAPVPSDFDIAPDSLPVLDADAVAERARSGIVLDARAPERYRGEAEPLDPQAGHIPGALNAPATDNTRNGFFLPEEELRAAYRALGVLDGPDAEGREADGAGSDGGGLDGGGPESAGSDGAGSDGNDPAGSDAGSPVGVYCGSGVTACHDVFVLSMLGVGAALFPPSWSGWSNDPDRPVATGTEG